MNFKWWTSPNNVSTISPHPSLTKGYSTIHQAREFGEKILPWRCDNPIILQLPWLLLLQQLSQNYYKYYYYYYRYCYCRHCDYHCHNHRYYYYHYCTMITTTSITTTTYRFSNRSLAIPDPGMYSTDGPSPTLVIPWAAGAGKACRLSNSVHCTLVFRNWPNNSSILADFNMRNGELIRKINSD